MLTLFKSDMYMSVLDAAVVGIYRKDLNGKYVECNRHVLTMFGLADETKIIGRNELDFLAQEEASHMIKIDQEVLANGYYEGEQEITLASGEAKIFYAFKDRVFDRDGNVVGVVGISLDITSRKKAEGRLLQSQLNTLAELKHQQFRTIAGQVAHDIASPLTALGMIIPGLADIPENLRSTLNQAVTRIGDITSELLRQFNPKARQEKMDQVKLCASMELMTVLSAKRAQYSRVPVNFFQKIDDDAYFSFILADHEDWQCMLSNLVNNAVASLDGKPGVVQVELHATDENVVVVVADNGKGMSQLLCKTILKCMPVTEDNRDGHGIGLSQVAGVLQRNSGLLGIESSLGSGTRMSVTFPRVAPPDGMATQILLREDQIVLVLDDDTFMHGAWNKRFENILLQKPLMKLLQFSQGEDLLAFLLSLSETELNRICLLSDYELLNQKLNGLDIIEQQKIPHAILVTSHYGNAGIISRADRLKIRVLPKCLAFKVPILVTERAL